MSSSTSSSDSGLAMRIAAMRETGSSSEEGSTEQYHVLTFSNAGTTDLSTGSGVKHVDHRYANVT